jgi:hypothetical protein
MIEALIDEERQGRRRPSWRGRMHAKISNLALALRVGSGDYHALMCRLQLEHIDHLDDMIARRPHPVDDHLACAGHQPGLCRPRPRLLRSPCPIRRRNPPADRRLEALDHR